MQMDICIAPLQGKLAAIQPNTCLPWKDRVFGFCGTTAEKVHVLW